LSFPRRRESKKWENWTFYETINIDGAALYLYLKQANRRISKGGFTRAAQALAPRVAQSFL